MNMTNSEYDIAGPDEDPILDLDEEDDEEDDDCTDDEDEEDEE